MKNLPKLFLLAILSTLTTGCFTQDVPPAHKGRLFEKAGFWNGYSGGNGFLTNTLNPGTHKVGYYDEVFMADCSETKVDQKMQALTKDGVQFSLELNVTFSANCDDKDALGSILSKLTPIPAKEGAPPNRTISPGQIYNTYMLPSLGEAVRVAVSPHIANDINANREEIFKAFNESFRKALDSRKPSVVQLYALNMSNLDFPDDMDKANAERAAQAILRDKAIAEQEKVKAETDTAKLTINQETEKAKAKAAEIDIVGAALRRNPEYVLRDMYWLAGEKGNLVMLPSDWKGAVNLAGKK